MKPAGTPASRHQAAARTLPTFLVVGAAKAGTTSLHHYLRRHPEVVVPTTKELDFFVEERNWRRGLEWYAGQFEARAGAAAVGEVSPRYTAFPQHEGVPERIASVLPGVRLVYLVRHPIERMRSHYLQLAHNGWERRPIEEALLAYPGYLDQSRYWMQAQRYLRHFPPERLLVVQAERLRSEREATLARIHAFLGIGAVAPPQSEAGEFNRAVDKRVPRRGTAGLRRMAAASRVGRLVPERGRAVLRRWAERPARLPSTDLPAGLRARLEDELRPEVAALRPLMDPGFDGWGLA